MKISVQTLINASPSIVWQRYTTPADIVMWNAASDDWHTTRSTVDLTVGGKFCSRMEAKDGSFGFDFEGTYLKITEPTLIEYEFGGRIGTVTFEEKGLETLVTVVFDGEETHSIEQQREGWQAILTRFKHHVEATR